MNSLRCERIAPEYLSPCRSLLLQILDASMVRGTVVSFGQGLATQGRVLERSTRRQMMEDIIASSCLFDSSLRGVDFRGARGRVDPDGSISTSFSSASSLEVRAEGCDVEADRAATTYTVGEFAQPNGGAMSANYVVAGRFHSCINSR